MAIRDDGTLEGSIANMTDKCFHLEELILKQQLKALADVSY